MGRQLRVWGRMARPRFHRAVGDVAKDVLEPLGFRTRYLQEPGYAPFFSFMKPWKIGFDAGIGLYAAPGTRGFVVELGIVPEGGDFFRAAPLEMGPWRTTGLRLNIATVLNRHRADLGPFDGDLFVYEDEMTLEQAVRRAFALALECGPAVWDELGRRLVKARSGRG